MSYNLNVFLKSCLNKKIAFIGMGVSNFDAIILFLKNNIDVTILDKKEKKNIGEKYEILKQLGANFVCGERYLDNLTQYDIVIRSPGMYFNDERLQKAIENGTVVTSEMELFFEFCPCKIIAVTGSDGKTTTTTLIAKILEEEGYSVHLGGNIGKALLCELKNIHPLDIAVVELSSFQLLSLRKSSNIAIITNISKNHLDVHKNMEEYIKAKENIFIHQNAFGKVILNKDNKICYSLKEKARGFVESFSMKEKVLNGSFYDNQKKTLCYVKNGKIFEVLKEEDILLLGKHNVENFLAAISATFNMVDIKSIKNVATTFKGVKHRLELIKKENSITWYNDSIATSPTRTMAALNCFDKNIILIAGGYDKNLPFDELANSILKKVKSLILMGSTADKIEKSIKNSKNFYDNFKIYKVKLMKDAVKKAKEIAENGDFVLFSPACASFDLYNNFEERGEDFKNLVQNF